MNLPNKLTILRIILSVIFAFVLFQQTFISILIALSLFIIASITDFLDGYIARKYNLITDFGKIMDPIADKFLILAAFFIFAYYDVIYMWMFVVIAFREISLTIFRLIMIKKGAVLAAENLGKYKTVFQILSIVVILLYLLFSQAKLYENYSQTIFHLWYYINQLLMWITVILTVVSGVSVLKNNKNLMVRS